MALKRDSQGAAAHVFAVVFNSLGSRLYRLAVRAVYLPLSCHILSVIILLPLSSVIRLPFSSTI